MTMVCAADGVAVAESRKGFVHIGELPKEADEHDVTDVITREEWEAGIVKKSNLQSLVVALMMHHRQFDPDPACKFLAQVEAALRSPVA